MKITDPHSYGVLALLTYIYLHRVEFGKHLAGFVPLVFVHRDRTITLIENMTLTVMIQTAFKVTVTTKDTSAYLSTLIPLVLAADLRFVLPPLLMLAVVLPLMAEPLPEKPVQGHVRLS